MAAPTPGARPLPNGIRNDDGFKTELSFENEPALSIWDIETGIPGITAGDPIETTTHRNDVMRTRALRQLKDLKPFTIVGAYANKLWRQLMDQVGVEQTLTLHLPNNDRIAFYGGINDSEFAAGVEGAQSRVTVTVVPTNVDPDTREEEEPVYTVASGT